MSAPPATVDEMKHGLHHYGHTLEQAMKPSTARCHWITSDAINVMNVYIIK